MKQNFQWCESHAILTKTASNDETSSIVVGMTHSTKSTVMIQQCNHRSQTQETWTRTRGQSTTTVAQIFRTMYYAATKKRRTHKSTTPSYLMVSSHSCHTTSTVPLHCLMLCCAALSHAALRCIVSCCAALHCLMLRCAALSHAVLRCIVSRSAVLHGSCCAALHCLMLCCAAGNLSGLLDMVQKMVAGKADKEEIQVVKRLLGDKVNLADHQVCVTRI